MEIWEDVVGYEGLYKVSNYGNVYSVPRIVHTGFSTQNKGGIILKQQIDISGYKTVCLCDGKGDRRPKKVHRLVAMAFIDNPDNYPCVNHKDENKTNNHADNLEWCTVAYNNNYCTHQQRSSKSRINHIKRSTPIKCVETQVTYPSMREAERQTGINQGQLWRCVNEPNRVAKGLHWTKV